MRRLMIITLALAAFVPEFTAQAARLKDVATIRGVRSNQLIGYGIVVGLNGTGDDQQVYFTLRSVQMMLRRLGVPAAQEKVFDLRNLKLKNTAAVIVTSSLPPFARSGTKIDVTVSSLGNASSLRGGTLLMTPLRGVDLKVYGLAQGALTVGGFEVSGRSGSSVKKGHMTVARVPRGAIIEREVPSRFLEKGNQLVVALRRPDFTTATRLASAINTAVGEGTAVPTDPATIIVQLKSELAKNPIAAIAKIEAVNVDPDTPATVIINERTGTVVVGRDVRISQVAITHGSLTLEIDEKFKVSQPGAFGAGATTVVPDTQVRVREGSGQFTMIRKTAGLADVVKALNALGVSPQDMVAILQALEGSGALPAKLVVQ